MVADLAAVLALDPRGVEDVVNMPVRDQKKGDFVAFGSEPFGSFLRGIDQNAVLLQEKTICVEDAAGESLDAHKRDGTVNEGYPGAGARFFRLEWDEMGAIQPGMCYFTEALFDLFPKPVSLFNF
jgi:hypothetical protein